MANTDRTGGLAFGPLGRLMLWLGAISVAFIIFVIWAPIDPWFPSASKQGREIDALFKFMLATSGVIFIYVQGLLLGFALQYRRRKSDPDSALGTQLHGNTRLELAWTAAPAVLLVVLTVLSLGVWSDLHTQRSNQLNLTVRGYQFGFAYSLPQYGIKEQSTVVLPINRPVYVTERASDVIHAFWVPAFRVQQDMVPGITTYERFTPVEKGTFEVVCTQFCGSGHSGMISHITVADEATFVTWLRQHGATSLPSSGATAQLIQR